VASVSTQLGQLIRDQADVLTAYGWSAADILLTPESGIPDARAGCSGRYGGGWNRPEWNWNTTAQGIEAWRSPHVDRGQDVVLTWAELRAASKALPERERWELFAARRRAQLELQRTVAPYLAGRQAPFVMPPPQWRRDARKALQAALAAACDALIPAEELVLFEVPA
jgi:hypothetical protein